jgi:hypothetical protein
MALNWKSNAWWQQSYSTGTDSNRSRLDPHSIMSSARPFPRRAARSRSPLRDTAFASRSQSKIEALRNNKIKLDQVVHVLTPEQGSSANPERDTPKSDLFV